MQAVLSVPRQNSPGEHRQGGESVRGDDTLFFILPNCRPPLATDQYKFRLINHIVIHIHTSCFDSINRFNSQVLDLLVQRISINPQEIRGFGLHVAAAGERLFNRARSTWSTTS